MSDSLPDPLLSPYVSPVSDAQVVPVATEALPPPVSPPRIWPLVVVFLVGMTLVIGSQIVFAVVLLALLVSEGNTVPEAANALLEKITDPPMFLAAGALSQLSLGICATSPSR